MKTEKNNPQFGSEKKEGRMNAEVGERLVSPDDLESLISAVEKEYTESCEGIELDWKMGFVSSSHVRYRHWLARVLNRLEKKPISRNLAERILHECSLDSAGSLLPKPPINGELNDHQHELLKKLGALYQTIGSTEHGRHSLLFNVFPDEFEDEVEDLRFQAIEAGLPRVAIGDFDYLHF